MLWKKDTLFCDMNPLFFEISVRKEILKRHMQDLIGQDRFSRTKYTHKLPVSISSCSSHMIKRGRGIDPQLQINKAVNIRIAAGQLNGLIIRPGEVFSVWKTIGNTTKRKGYLDGRVIENNRLKPGIGGGLCNLGNTIHRVILNSPLDIIEFHSHSDALAPDEGKRVPFSTGTSISYNNIDYRVKNNTDQKFQLLVWCEQDNLRVELRAQKEIPWRYELLEEDHHFRPEDDKYFRVSRIYRLTIEKETGAVLKKELLLDNHSEVMFDYDLIPADQIRS